MNAKLTKEQNEIICEALCWAGKQGSTAESLKELRRSLISEIEEINCATDPVALEILRSGL